MATEMNPPVLKKSTSYELWKLETQAWTVVTDLSKKKQAVAVALRIPENDKYNIKEKLFCELKLDDLNSENVTYVMSFLINRCDKYRVRKIKMDEMFMISYGGLRGAVCFSLVALLDEKEFPMKNMFVTTTLFVIFFTVFVQGGTIKYLVKWMRVSLADTSKDMIMYEELNQHVSDHMMAAIEEVVGHSGKFYLMEKMDRIDNQYFRPILLKNPKKIGVTEISQYYEKLMMKEHRKNLQLCGVSNNKLPHVESGVSIHTSESELNFRKIVEFDEQEEYDKQENLRDKRDRLRSQKSISKGAGDDVQMRKLFRQALASSSHRFSGKFHDKNFINDTRRLYAGRLRKKHKQNARLSTMQSVCHPQLEHTMSWDPQETDECVRRTSEAQLKFGDRTAGKAHTIDLSGSPAGSPAKGVHPHFHLELENVFEEDGDEKSKATEESPLIDNSTVNAHTASRVRFANDDSKDQGDVETPRLERTPSLEYGDVQKGGPLLRQDAMKEDNFPAESGEIAMKNLGDSKLEKQKSL